MAPFPRILVNLCVFCALRDEPYRRALQGLADSVIEARLAVGVESGTAHSRPVISTPASQTQRASRLASSGRPYRKVWD